MCKLLFLFYKSIMLKLMIFIHEEDFVWIFDFVLHLN
jgi:hypothetical protein